MSELRTAEEWEVIARTAIDERDALTVYCDGLQRYASKVCVERDDLRARVRRIESHDPASGGVPVVEHTGPGPNLPGPVVQPFTALLTGLLIGGFGVVFAQAVAYIAWVVIA